MKKCTKCQEVKELSCFFKDSTTNDGFGPHCKICKVESQKIRRAKNPEKYKLIDKKIQLKLKFGISIEQKHQMLVEQGSCCAICKISITQYLQNQRYDFAVDHDHETGRIRGLLCTNCNHLLGVSKDNINILQSAIDYLNKSNSIPLGQSNVIPLKKIK